MTDLVDRTLARWRREPFVYGQDDCMLSMGKYLAAAGAKDNVAIFAGRYGDQDGALAIMAEYGGAASLFDDTDGPCVIAVRVEGKPKRGDILAVACGDDTIGALCTGDMAALRLERGVAEVALRFIELRGVWRVSA